MIIATPTETDEVSETEDAKRLVDLLGKQGLLAERLAQASSVEERATIEKELREVRSQCIELVDRYFRQVLHPILQKRFPEKVSRPQHDVSDKVPMNAIAQQFTQLLNDFFVQVLDDPKLDNPFWEKRAPIELRNYASIAISNRGLRDAIRRRQMQESFSDEGVRKAYQDALAAEIEARFADARNDATDIDPAHAIDVINDWETTNDQRLVKFARLLRLNFIAGMSMEQVAADIDLNVKTAYRIRQAALAAVRAELDRRN